MYLLRHDITNLGGFGGSTLHYNFPEIIWDIKREKKGMNKHNYAAAVSQNEIQNAV